MEQQRVAWGYKIAGLMELGKAWYMWLSVSPHAATYQKLTCSWSHTRDFTAIAVIWTFDCTTCRLRRWVRVSFMSYIDMWNHRWKPWLVGKSQSWLRNRFWNGLAYFGSMHLTDISSYGDSFLWLPRYAIYDVTHQGQYGPGPFSVSCSE